MVNLANPLQAYMYVPSDTRELHIDEYLQLW